MRIALDATYSIDSHPTGIAVYSRELISGLSRTYPQDELLCCYRPKQFRRSSVVPFPNARRRLLLPPIPTFRADLFHALNQRVDRRPSRRVVSTFHDLFVMTGEYSSPEFRSRFTGQARRAAANSDFIIAVSQFTAHQVHDLLGVDRSRIRVVPHGANYGLRGDPVPREKIILSVGALQLRKNIRRLVEAFESAPADWTLVLAGSPTGYRAADILQAIERSKCRDRILVTGYVSGPELARLYARASIFAFPSLAEGFGIPVLEAMAQGVAVLTSKGSALEEVAGDAALLVDPEETEDIAAALLRLIQHEDLRSSLIERGRARAQLFPWARAIRSTHAVYEEALR